MSAALIAHNEDLKKLDEEGFELEVRDGFLLVHNIPHVRSDRSLARGILISKLELGPDGMTTARPLADHTMFFVGDTPCHKDGSPLSAVIHSSARQTIAPGIEVDHYFSSKPENNRPYANYHEKVTTYEGHLGRPARSYDPSANGRTGRKLAAADDLGPFTVPDTGSSRYLVVDIAAKLALARIAIIGLGGTGGYVLDLLSKTPAKQIHLYDHKQYFNQTTFRSPGSPDRELLRKFPKKVEYYAEVYSRLHRGIVPHPVNVTTDNINELTGFDFAFVCVDKGSARRAIAQGLHQLAVPFIDTGIGMDREGMSLDGVVRTTFVHPDLSWDAVEKLLPFGDDDDEDDVYKAAIQTGDLNCLNATLAVTRFKRWAGFYRDARGEMNSSYMVEGNMLANREAL